MNNIQQLIQTKSNERIIRAIKHSYWVLLPWLSLGFGLLMVDFFLLYYFLSKGSAGLVIFFMVLAGAIWFSSRLIFLWVNNVFVVTNSRVADIERQGLFSRTVSSYNFAEIKNVAGRQQGVWQTIFHYGDLIIDLVDKKQPLILYNLPRPFELLETINQQLNIVKIDSWERKIKQIIRSLEQLPRSEQERALDMINEHFAGLAAVDD